MPEPQSLIQSIDRAVAVLNVVKNASGPVRNCDIARTIGLSQRATHNFVRALLFNGYLAQTANRQYVVGPAALELVLPIQNRYEKLGSACADIVIRLARDTKTNAFLGFEYYGKLYCALLGRSNGVLEACGRQFWLDVLHASGPGLIMIGVQGIEYFKSVTREPLKKFTPYTVVDMDEIAKRSAGIIKQGYALLRSEHVDRIADLAVPVRNRSGKIVAGLSLSFLESRLQNDDFNIDEKLEQLRDAAANISLSADF